MKNKIVVLILFLMSSSFLCARKAIADLASALQQIARNGGTQVKRSMKPGPIPPPPPFSSPGDRKVSKKNVASVKKGNKVSVQDGKNKARKSSSPQGGLQQELFKELVQRRKKSGVNDSTGSTSKNIEITSSTSQDGKGLVVDKTEGDSTTLNSVDLSKEADIESVFDEDVEKFGKLYESFEQTGGTFLKNFQYYLKTLYRSITRNTQKILVPTGDQEKEAEKILKKLKQDSSGKEIDKNRLDFIDKGLKVLLKIDPKLIQDVVALRKKLKISDKSYDLMVNEYRSIVNQVEYVLSLRQQSDVSGSSGDCKDVIRALSYPVMIGLLVDQARINMSDTSKKDRDREASRKFVQDIGAIQKRLIEILNSSKKRLVKCINVGELVDNLENYENRVWHEPDAEKGFIISEPNQVLQKDKKFYKRLNVELYEIAEQAKKLPSEVATPADELKLLLQKQRIIRAISNVVGYYNLPKMCQSCFEIDLVREEYPAQESLDTIEGKLAGHFESDMQDELNENINFLRGIMNKARNERKESQRAIGLIEQDKRDEEFARQLSRKLNWV